MDLTQNVIYLKVPEGYVAFVEGLPGVNSRGETLAEVRENLKEAIALVVQANEELAAESAGKK